MSEKQANNDQGPRFTGGDHLIGFEKLIHHLMTCNELTNGRKAYTVIFAGGESGLSFGGNQMDMSKNPKSATLFADILKNATDSQGTLIFQENEVLAITGGKDNPHLREKGKTPESVFGKNLDRVKAALASPCGMSMINEAYPKAIKKGIARAEKATKQMKNPAAKAFYSTDFGKAFLFEYNNQFGLELKGTFMLNYIDGDDNKTAKIDFTTDKDITAPTKIYTFKDHQRYIQSTEQWYKYPEMMNTRLEHSVEILNQYGLRDNGPLYLSLVENNTKDSPKLQCPVGKHPVKACIVRRRSTGLSSPRRAYCAKYPVKKAKKISDAT